MTTISSNLINQLVITFVFFLSFNTNNFCQDAPYRIQGRAQGTFYSISYYDSLHRDFKTNIDSILIDFDSSLSTYKTYSIISKINFNESVQTDSLFRTCFRKAKEINKLTNNYFDPTVKPLMAMWKFEDTASIALIDSSKVDSVMQFIGMDLITLTSDSILKSDQRLSLDFNSFAQGYSVDVVASFFEGKGIDSYLIEIGGEIRAGARKKNGKTWTIGIEKPDNNKQGVNKLYAIANLEQLSVATSGNYRKFKNVNGIKYGHTINPKTGYPFINPLLSVSVFSDKCIDADALSTSLLAMGYESAMAFIQEHTDIKCYLIYSNKEGKRDFYISDSLKDIVKSK